MRRISLIFALVALLTTTACSQVKSDSISQTTTESKQEITADINSQEVAPAKKDPNQKKSSNGAKADNANQVLNPGSYITLQDYEGSKERYINSDVVLFFNANWCSSCKIARDNIESSLDSIPSNLTIVLVDFDLETELRKKYGVTIQHTFVQIDKNGDELAKWAGSLTAEQIAENTV